MGTERRSLFVHCVCVCVKGGWVERTASFKLGVKESRGLHAMELPPFFPSFDIPSPLLSLLHKQGPYTYLSITIHSPVYDPSEKLLIDSSTHTHLSTVFTIPSTTPTTTHQTPQ